MDPTESDYSVRELSRLTLTLRDDLVFTPQTAGDDTYYIIEDPINSKFHRVGLAEYTFISLLNGTTSVGDVLRMVANVSPKYAFAEHEAAAICKWLVDSQLATTFESLHSMESVQQQVDASRGRWQRWNPVFTKLPLLCPDRYLGMLGRWFGWVHAPWATALWCIIVIYAVYLVISCWDRFAASSVGILAPANWIGIAACCLGLKILHEVSHGLACKRYGGTVREAGVMLLLLAPIPYIDATSSWRFTSKWQRIQTAAAGMYIELLLAALAVIIWHATEPGVVNHICYNVAIVGSTLTLVTNANPLMRFDGYYIFADLVEIPNLYSNSQEYLKRWACRHLLGMDTVVSQWAKSRGRIIAWYGVAALCWRISICVCLVIGARVLLHGAGIVLSCLAIGFWVGVPAIRFLRYLSSSPQLPNLLRLAAFSSVVGIGLPLLMWGIPWPGRVSAPAVVEYAPLTVVRASSPGFVRELHVHSGQQIEQGQMIVVLENDELAFELSELEIALQQSEVQCRAYKRSNKLSDFQAEYEQQLALRKKKHEKEMQVQQLAIRASAGGKIIGRNLESLVGTYIQEGAEIMSIGDESQKELTVSIAQADVDAFKMYLSRPVRVLMKSSGRFKSRLGNVEPQAKSDLPHPALGALLSGPLPVKAEASHSQKTNAGDRYVLLAPRFVGNVELDPDTSVALHAGQLATVTIRPFHESISFHLIQTVARWIRARVRVQADQDS